MIYLEHVPILQLVALVLLLLLHVAILQLVAVVLLLLLQWKTYVA